MTPYPSRPRTFGDVMLHGNADSTLQGIIPHTVVIDDPHGCVVPSPGVLILREHSMGIDYGHGKSYAMRLALEYAIDHGVKVMDIRMHDITHRKVEIPDVPHPEGPKRTRKSKQHLKGLRP